MDEDKIERLWEWFSGNERKIKNCIEDERSPGRENIVEQLNNLILDIGLFYWEIGQGSDNNYYLTISPNGDADLMAQSISIMESAPDLDGWELNYCKPSKEWDRNFKLYDDDMSEQHIDASNWRCLVTRNAEGTLDLILEAKNIAHLDNFTTKTAADLVVLNEIGEETKILTVRSIKTVDQLDDITESHKMEIKDLRKHFEALRT